MDLQRWFYNLEPAERSSAMSIVDDEHFLTFYMNLLRKENQQPDDGTSHTLFMVDHLQNLYEIARRKRSLSTGAEYSSETEESSNFRPGVEKLVSKNDASLLSFLSGGYNAESDTSDFDDPYLFDFLSSCKSESRVQCHESIDSSIRLSSPSPVLLTSVFQRDEKEVSGIKHESKDSYSRTFGLQSAIGNLVNIAVLNVASKLQNESQALGIDAAMKPQKQDQIQRNVEEPNSNHFSMASDLHEALSVSFATSGTGVFDCLFFMRPATENAQRLIEIFLTLSNGLMFSIRPSPEYVTSILRSREIPMTAWLSNTLRPPQDSGLDPCPVPYYMLLLSRIELSMWSAFFASASCIEASAAVDSTLSVGDAVDDEVMAGHFTSITLLPRTIARGQKDKVSSSTVSSMTEAPIRNSLMVLNRSPLYSLSCSSVMLTLGCILEEMKAAWRCFPSAEMLKILDKFPRAKSFYSDPKNVRGRSESIVDRLVLCPLVWVVDLAAERDVKRAYRYLETVISNSSHSDSGNLGGGIYDKNSVVDYFATAAMNAAVKTGPGIGAGMTVAASAASAPIRTGSIKFDKGAKRTGAVPHSATRSGDVEGATRSPSQSAAADAGLVTVRTGTAPLGLTRRNVPRSVPIEGVGVGVSKALPSSSTEPADIEVETEVEAERGVPRGDLPVGGDERVDKVQAPLIVESQSRVLLCETLTGKEETYAELHSIGTVHTAQIKKIAKMIKAKQRAASSLSDLADRKEGEIWASLGSVQGPGKGGNDLAPLGDMCSGNGTDSAPSIVAAVAPVIPHTVKTTPAIPIPAASDQPFRDVKADSDKSHTYSPLETEVHISSSALRVDGVCTDSSVGSVLLGPNVGHLPSSVPSTSKNTPPVPAAMATATSIIASLSDTPTAHTEMCKKTVLEESELKFLKEQEEALAEYSSAFSSEEQERRSRENEESFLLVQRNKRTPKQPRHPTQSDAGPCDWGSSSPGRKVSRLRTSNSTTKPGDSRVWTAAPPGLMGRTVEHSLPSWPLRRASEHSSGSVLNSTGVTEDGREDRRAPDRAGEPWRSVTTAKAAASSSFPSSFPPSFAPSFSSDQNSWSGPPLLAGSDYHTDPGLSSRSTGHPVGPGDDCMSPSCAVPRNDPWGLRTSGRGLQDGWQQGQGHGCPPFPVHGTPDRLGRMSLQSGDSRTRYPDQSNGSIYRSHGGGNLANNMSNSIGNNVSNNIGNNVGNNMGNNVSNNMGNNMGNNGSNNIGNNVSNNMGNNMNNYVSNNMNNNIGNNVGNNMGNKSNSVNNGGHGFNDYTFNPHNYNHGSPGPAPDPRNSTTHNMSRHMTQSSMTESMRLSKMRSYPYRDVPVRVKDSADRKAKAASLKLHKALTKNIRSFNNLMSGRMEVHKLVRIALYLELRSMVLSLWPSASVRIFGSCITGLALPTSDIDLVIQLTRQTQFRPTQYQPQFQFSPQPLTRTQVHPPVFLQDPRVPPLQPPPPQLYYQYSPQVAQHASPLRSEDTGATGDPPGMRRGRALSITHPPPLHVCPTSPSIEYSSAVSPYPETGEAVCGDGRYMNRSRSSSTGGQSSLLTNSPPPPRPLLPVPSLMEDRDRTSPLFQSPQRMSVLSGEGPQQVHVPIPLPSAPPSPEVFNGLFFALSSQLHMQVWASQVNPIPSATVPVIKLRVAADALLSNPAMQHAVFAAHQQQMLSSVLEPSTFPLPSPMQPLNTQQSRHEYISSTIPFPPPFPSIPPAGGTREPSSSYAALSRDRALSVYDEGQASLSDRSTILKHSGDGGDVGGAGGAGVKSPHSSIGPSDLFDENAPQVLPQRHSNLYQTQTQQILYPPSVAPFSSGAGTRYADLGGSVLGGAGPGVYPSFQPPTPFFAMLPFHLAAGVSIAVDITIEAGLHMGISSCDFVQQSLGTRSAVLPAVVKVVKALLGHAKLNVPFTGGLSSYSAFLLVLAAYDRCQYSDARQALTARRKGYAHAPHPDVSSDGSEGVGAGVGSGGLAARVVTEGEVFMHFLSLFSSAPSSGFNSSCQGIDVRSAEPFMLSDLTPDQQVSIAGGGLWIVDPIDSTKNVARPSFAFRQAQVHFKQCLDKIEGAAGSLGGQDPASVDFLKLVMSMRL